MRAGGDSVPKRDPERHSTTAGAPESRGLAVAVTGAGGFVGAAVCADLEAAGHRVVRLARRPIDGHPDTVLWDLRGGHDDAAPLPAVDAVVHCAAAISTFDADGTAREANVGGSLRVAAAWPGVPIVYVSSASVYPASHVASGGRPLREDDATGDGLHDPYSRSKLEAERALVAEAEATGRSLTILRPSIVYGPGDRHILPSIHRLRFGGWVLLPGGRLPWSLTPIGLLCDAVRASVKGAAPGVQASVAGPAASIDGAAPRVRILNVAEEPPERVRDLFLRLLSAEAGRPLRAISFPAWPVRAYAWCVEAVWRVLRLRSEPVVTRSAVAYIRKERVLDLGALRRLVGLG
jgi:nucleoside-diphosphate-sugar epimerase